MSPRHLKLAACLLLIVVTLAVYAGVGGHDFVNFDDDVYVTDNPVVQAGLTVKGLAWAFTNIQAAGFWLPLTWLSHMLDCQLFGLNPGGHHLTNLLFHLANTLLLFFFFVRTTQALGPSFLAAALFAWHPLHVESVAWVTERKDVLSTFFWLLTMWTYVGYVDSPGLRRYLLVLACFGLGLMAKPMVVTLPFVLLLLDYWPLGRLAPKGPAAAKASPKPGPGVPMPRLLWEKAPLFVLAALFSAVTFYAQKEVAAVSPLQDLSLTSRLSNALVAYVSYLAKMIWPSGLAVFYPHPGDAIPLWQPLGAGLLLASLSLFIIWQTRRHPYLLMGWLWYLGTLVPVIGLVQVGSQALADRFTYVPLIGPFIILAWGLAALTAGWRGRKFLLPLGAGVLLSALAVTTWLQVRHWRDSISLFAHVLQVTSNNPIAQDNLGAALLAQGKVDQAIAHFEEALRLRPQYATAHNHLGNALFSQGEVERAISHYGEALRFRPNYAEAHNNLGNVLFSQGEVDQAIFHYTEALRLRPHYAMAHNNLGATLLSQGKVDQAVAHFEEALRLRPNYIKAHNNLGMAFLSQGKVDQAMAQYQEAIRLKPDYPEALDNLARILATAGDQRFRNGPAALPMAEKANRLTGYRRPEMLDTLAAAYAEVGRFPEALQACQKALDLAAAAGNPELVKEIELKRRLYQEGRPYHAVLETGNLQ